MNAQAQTAQTDGEFIVFNYYHDPVGYVRDVIGAQPDKNQITILEAIAQYPRVAVASGHGIGKTAVFSWAVRWFLNTRPYPEVVATANTQQQLLNKTWRELSKWNQRAINSDWFKWTATKLSLKDAPETWFAVATPWSENNADAFQGTHEDHVLMGFDEASKVADAIWDASEGAMTTDDCKWIVFGNPTQNTGRFRECFGKFRHRWHCLQIDSRESDLTNKEQIQAWIDDYGEDSDFVRVRVKGQFPRAAVTQFISTEIAENAMQRDLDIAIWAGAPRLLGIDVARFGDDQSVISFRQGRKLHWQVKFRELDTMQLSAMAAERIQTIQPDATFVDGVGIGAGVVDRLRALGHKVIDVQAGVTASDKETYFNLRTEMWARLREWLEGGDIPDDSELRDDLIGPEYGFDAKMRMQLEKKEDMKKRGLASPDCGDSLALTFAYPVVPFNDQYTQRHYEPATVADY